MAEPLKPVGFWSYTSSDDAHSGRRLSELRLKLAGELQLLIGRRQPVRIFQDTATIPLGSDWLRQIYKALDESSFLLPIVTPAFLESEMCCQEVMRFHQREQQLGRDDLIFPFHYIDVSHIEPHEVHDPAVLALLKSRQRFDFAALRHHRPGSKAVATKLAGLASAIRAALWRSAVAETPAGQAAPPAEPSPKPSGLATPAILQPPAPGMVMREAPGPEMVLIPPGRFLMGVPEAEAKREATDDSDARPRHLVVIARPFWLGRYPVTQGEYADFAAATGRGSDPWTSPSFPQDERHPVVNVSHADAEAYVAWLSRQTGQTWRLPSEAEWEYAARAGTTTARYWGEDAGKPGEHAHFGPGKGTCPVGSFKPNAFGLHDMLGNVWEWTADHWQADYNGAPSDGSAWTEGGAAFRVLRGGSWSNEARLVRSASRGDAHPSNRFEDFGFRCARVQV